MQATSPIVKDLVLIGGGHSHIAVLKRFGMEPVAGLQITLITRDLHTPYSGMLPGYIAGHYAYDECHIDLRRLALFAKARVFHSSVTGIDLNNRRIICDNRPPVRYDVVSINVGSHPHTATIPGALDHSLPVKPIDLFLQGWDALLERVTAATNTLRLAIVGGGAGGVELSLATQYHLRNELRQAGKDPALIENHLLTETRQVLPTHNPRVRAKFERVLSERGIRVYLNHRVAEVTNHKLICENGARIGYDGLIWVASASAQTWLAESGLTTDDQGFVKVDVCLQSLSHPNVFAAGDIATVVKHPRAKSGVFAVRQGPPLARNLRRLVKDRSPKPFIPQSKFLSLISTGDKYAIASRSFWSVEGRWVWKVKDWIDRRFMKKYDDLPAMNKDESHGTTEKDPLKDISAVAMRCGGCGAKIGATVLSRVVDRLQPTERSDVLVGLNEPDDAAVSEVPPGKVVVQSVDYFRSFIDDTYVFGQVAANHALGDLFAMGAEPQSAMAIATVPYGREAIVEEQLYQLMSGALKVLNECNAALVGGHSSEGAELSFGLSVTGIIDRDSLMRKGGMQPGDRLILTKPLGTGALFAADMRYRAKGRWIDAALTSMLVSSESGARCIHRHGATACTDITGFGVLGHLAEMIKASDVDVKINLDTLPILDGALDMIEAGIFSSLQSENVRLRRAISNLDQAQDHPRYPILFDPQTAGGLMASVPKQHADTCLAELKDLGYKHSVIIGRVLKRSKALEPITLKL